MSDNEYEDDNQYDNYENEEYEEVCGDEYELLKQEDFNSKREEVISEFISISSLPKDEAELVLIEYNWNLEMINNIWFENTKKIKESCGIENPISITNKYKDLANTEECLVCYDTFCEETPKIGLKCGHFLCQSCFYEYLKNILTNDPLFIIRTKCPQSGCSLIVTHSIFEKVFKEDQESLKKYNKFLIKNFTESNADIKSCPNPKCEIIARVPGHGMKEITCNCGTVFCFKCLKEGHRPCDCDMLERWDKLSKEEDANILWLKCNTKECPNCKKNIEKNQGCNHMTCRKEVGGCGHEFCWICLAPWKTHGSSYYKCIKKTDDQIKQEESSLSDTKNYLKRLEAYGEKIIEHKNGQKYAEKLKKDIDNYKIIFIEKKGIPYDQLEFLDEGIKTIIDSRRMLKYTYILGYYLKQIPQVALYEHTQYLLDQKTDMLHDKFEGQYITDMLKIINKDIFLNKFNAFKSSVVNLTSTILTFKTNVLKEIEGKMEQLINYDMLYKKKGK